MHYFVTWIYFSILKSITKLWINVNLSWYFKKKSSINFYLSGAVIYKLGKHGYLVNICFMVYVLFWILVLLRIQNVFLVCILCHKPSDKESFYFKILLDHFMVCMVAYKYIKVCIIYQRKICKKALLEV